MVDEFVKEKLEEIKNKESKSIKDLTNKSYIKSCLLKKDPKNPDKGWIIISAGGDGKKAFDEFIEVLKEIEPDSIFVVVNKLGTTEY